MARQIWPEVQGEPSIEQEKNDSLLVGSNRVRAVSTRVDSCSGGWRASVDEEWEGSACRTVC